MRKGSKSSRRIVDVYEDVSDEDGGFEDRRRYGKMDNYEYELPENFEDEEIDSDEAFNEEDEEKYGYLFNKKIVDQVDENEGEDEEELDQDDNDDDDDDDDDENVEDLDADEGLIRDIQERLGGGPAPKSSRVKFAASIRGEDAAEGDFDLFQTEANSQVKLAEVAVGLGQGERLDKAKKALLRIARKQGSSAPVGSEKAKRMERQIAFKKARHEISRWMPQVEENRNKRTLVLKEDEGAVPVSLSTAQLAVGFEPTTDLEKEISNIMKQSGADESSIRKYEELQIHKLSVEEIAARNAQLAKMRSMLFYEEIKARRKKRIKSKRYRKVQKKQKEAAKATLEELRLLDPAAAEAEAEKRERERIEERVTLRHRNKSKWIQGVLRSGAAKDPEMRAVIQEQLARHQELRRKMDVGSDDEDFEEEDGAGQANDAHDASISSSSSEDDEAYVPDPEQPLPKAAKEAPEFSDGTYHVKNLNEGFKARASGFLSAQGDVSGILSKVVQEEENDDDHVEGEKEVPPVANSAKWMSESLRSQMEVAPATKVAELGKAKDLVNSGLSKSNINAEERAALVRIAFAEDDAVELFADEKKRTENGAEEKDAAEADDSLPGWGSWTGEGAVQERKKRRKTFKDADQKKKERNQQRAAAPDHVIVNPKASEVGKNYKVSQIPFPFTSKEQYEAEMALPLGADWNASMAFEDLRQPEVKTLAGAYLKPIKYVGAKSEKKKKIPKNLQKN